MNKNLAVIFILMATLALSPVHNVSAQMISNVTPIIQQGGVTPSSQDLQDIQTGQDMYDKFQNKQVTCTQLKDADFEKIGEYAMDQRFGNTNQHIQMNNIMKQMMGEGSEENMHIRIGRITTKCDTDTSKKGGASNMMGWDYSGMMNTGIGFSGTIVCIVVLIDLILLGIWLWKQINKK